jgi:hypothetical protein
MDCVGPIVAAIVATHYNPNPYWMKRRIKVIAKYTCYYSKRRKLNPYMVLGIMRHESFFRPRLISKTNDYGLMQLNKKYFWGRCNLLKIRCNIKEGTRFLSAIRRAYRNAKFHWLRKYNWYSYKHHLRVLWLTRAYKEAKGNKKLYKLIRSGKYKRLKLNYKCINHGLCLKKE